MTKVAAFHTDTDSEDPVHHVYDDCPAGERIIRDGNAKQGDGSFRLCDFCDTKNHTGHF